MKRNSEEKEGEGEEITRLLVGNDDLWCSCIFPFLWSEPVVLWFKLGRVCKHWSEMIRNSVKEHHFGTVCNWGIAKEKYEILRKRFGTNLNVLEMHYYAVKNMKHYTSVKKLSIIGKEKFGHEYGAWILPHHLSLLTSLTLGPYIIIQCLNQLPNLIHLSIMYITDDTKEFMSISCLKNLERLHIGSINSENYIKLQNYVPIDIRKLTFLETNSHGLPQEMKYSGQCRILYNYTRGSSRFEGFFREGKKEGLWHGSYRNGTIQYGAEWKDGIIQSGWVESRCDSLRYEGDLEEYVNGEVNPNGYGKLYSSTDSKLIYDGEFAFGNYHGEGKLYKDGILTYDGFWEFGEMVSPSFTLPEVNEIVLEK